MAYHEVTPEEILAKAKSAAEIIKTYDQERVDNLCKAICAAVYPLEVWGSLCDEAVDETGLGDKVTKRTKRNELKLILRDCLRSKSVGIIEENPEKGLVKYAKPVGVIAALIPETSPCVTPAGHAIYTVKARDVLICFPHPRAKKVTCRIVNIIRDVLVREGAPADIIQVIENPGMTLAQELTRRADLVITPEAGDSTVIIDDTADTKERAYEAAANTRISKCFDFGAGGSCAGNLIVHESVYDNFVEGLIKEGAYIPTREQAEAIKKVMWDETGRRLPDTVAISAQALAKTAGFEIGAGYRFIAVTDGGQKDSFTINNADDIKKCIGKDNFFSTEKLTTLLTLFKYGGEFQTALDIMQEIFDKAGGKNNSCGIYSWDDEHIHRLGLCVPVSLCTVRQPADHGNITLNNYMNTTLAARPIQEDMPSLQELFGEFYQDGMNEE